MAGNAVSVERLLPWIGGKSRLAGRFEDLVEPYRGRLVATVGYCGTDEVDAALTSARDGSAAMAMMPVHERARLLRRLADLVAESSEEFARDITGSTGKVIRHTRREAQRAPWTIRAAATAAETLTTQAPPTDAIPGGENALCVIERRPFGVVAAVTPFNAPLNLVAHKLAPALAVGNAIVIKPAPEAPGPALRLARLCTEAGFPPGAVNVVPGQRDTAEALLSDPRVDLISFTGGVSAGRTIHALAGVRPVLLELGGNSANIVHEDADLALALRECVAGGFSNNGQSCNSVQRIIVHESLYEDFTKGLAAAAADLRLGDPMDPQTDVGPLINEASAQRVLHHMERAVAAGARLWTGGSRDGAVVVPTVLSDVSPEESFYCDEAFAPVVMTESYSTFDEAIEYANRTPFGLQAAVFTSSTAVAVQAFRHVRCGGLVVNKSSNFRLDQLPYGGVGQSGIGREGPMFAAQEMTYLKTMVVGPLDR